MNRDELIDNFCIDDDFRMEVDVALHDMYDKYGRGAYSRLKRVQLEQRMYNTEIYQIWCTWNQTILAELKIIWDLKRILYFERTLIFEKDFGEKDE